MKKLNIKTYLSFVIFVVVLFSWAFWIARAAQNWTIWNLFQLMNITNENWVNVTNVYRLWWGNIMDGTISNYELKVDSVTTDKIKNNSVITSKIKDNSVTTDKIKNWTILLEDLSGSINLGWTSISQIIAIGSSCTWVTCSAYCLDVNNQIVWMKRYILNQNYDECITSESWTTIEVTTYLN